jgi:hypothetical protein
MCDHCMNDKGQMDESLRAYYHGCQVCGVIPDEDGECECPPDEYIRPGTETLMYLNVYEVTRHFGGHEEGGWWYNHHEPIASIPVKAVSVEGHSDVCRQCYMARRGETHHETGEKYEMCKWGYDLKPVDQEKVDEFRAYLEDLYGDRREGNIYSVLGGMEVIISLEDHPGERTPRPHYE